MRDHDKNKWKAFAPILAAVLVVACVAVSLSTYTPAVYEVMAMPPEIDPDDGEELKSAGESGSRVDEGDGETADDDDAVDALEESIELLMAEDAAAYRDGVYYGSAMGFRGNIEVRVVIEGGRIVSISVVSSVDDEEYLGRAKGLIAKIISSQSTNVDTVSGATYSSVGIINAVRSALSKAAVSESAVSETSEVTEIKTAGISSGAETFSVPEVEEGETGAFPYPDGTYYGTGWGYLDGEIVAAVEIKDHTIVSVRIVSAGDQDEEYFTMAEVLTDLIVSAQSTDIDVVSGATYSSNGILEAVRNALEAAKAAADAAGTSQSAGSTGTADAAAGSGDTAGVDKSDGASGEGSSADQGGNTESGDKSTGASGDEDGQDWDGDTEGEDAEDRLYADGTYAVTVSCTPDEYEEFDSYEITVAVTLEGDRIVGVERLSEVGTENEVYVERAWNGYLWRNTVYYPGVPEQVMAIEKGELTEEAVEQVDVVTSATCTSGSIKEACSEALRLAAAALEEERAAAESEAEGQAENPDESNEEGRLLSYRIAFEAITGAGERHIR